MDIVIKCPACSMDLTVDASAAGAQIKCPQCNTLLIVPKITADVSQARGAKSLAFDKNKGMDDGAMAKMLADAHARMLEEVGKGIVGQKEAIDQIMIAIFARSHCLLEGVPGLAKTYMIKSLSEAMDLSFKRVQFTPDLMPADITGTEVIEENRTTGARERRFLEGPLFANVILADEINRTPPRTQSALLEAMSDSQVSVDGQTHKLPAPFMIIATQNPFEFEGTYPLPESQLDRFLLRTTMGYPPREDEMQVLVSHRESDPVDGMQPVIDATQVMELQHAVRDVRVDDAIYRYVLNIVESTRECDELHVGISTRGALCLTRAAQSLALIEGRSFVTPDDVKRLSVPVLAHRVIAKGYLHGGHRDAVEALVRRIVEDTTVPD